MRHLWSGVAVALISLAATAAAQAPLSPSGAVNPREPPAAAGRGGAPSGTVTGASTPAAEAPVPAGAAPDATATSRSEAASPAGSENKTAVARPKRPVRGAGRDGSRSSGSAASRGERYSGDDVADTLNARELSGFIESAGPVPVAPPMGPPPGYPRPPVFGPPGYYGPPPGYWPPGYGPPLYPPPMMRPPY